MGSENGSERDRKVDNGRNKRWALKKVQKKHRTTLNGLHKYKQKHKQIYRPIFTLPKSYWFDYHFNNMQRRSSNNNSQIENSTILRKNESKTRLRVVLTQRKGAREMSRTANGQLKCDYVIAFTVYFINTRASDVLHVSFCWAEEKWPWPWVLLSGRVAVPSPFIEKCERNDIVLCVAPWTI